MSHADLIRETVSTFDTLGINFVKKLGVFEKSIADGVDRYISNDPRIRHFITFSNGKLLQELSFFCGERVSLADLQLSLGNVKIGYNFRENHTKFTFDVRSGFVESIFFIKENKFSVVADGYEERTPQGDKYSHRNLEFDFFCLRVHEGKSE